MYVCLFVGVCVVEMTTHRRADEQHDVTDDTGLQQMINQHQMDDVSAADDRQCVLYYTNNNAARYSHADLDLDPVTFTVVAAECEFDEEDDEYDDDDDDGDAGAEVDASDYIAVDELDTGVGVGGSLIKLRDSDLHESLAVTTSHGHDDHNDHELTSDVTGTDQ